MTLTRELEEYQERSRRKRDPAVQKIMNDATDALRDGRIRLDALNTGDHVPDFTLPDAAGEPVSSRELLKDGPLVLTFYRGAWCPYCNIELRALQNALPEIRAVGASLAAISPMTPDNSLSMREKNELEFPVLSDAANVVARRFGLAFELPASLKPVYANFGIDIASANGDETFELPMPATYVVDTNGRITWSFVNEDYTVRAEPADILNHLRVRASVPA